MAIARKKNALIPFLLRRTFSVQRGLVALHGQDVVGFGSDDLTRDFGLTAHCVDRHQAAGKFQHLQQLGSAFGGSLLLSSTTTWPNETRLVVAQALTM